MTRSSLPRLSITLALLLGAPLAWSAASDMEQLLTLSLAELGRVKVVTATLQEETLQSAPASITVYTRKQIRALGISRLEALMNYVPGFQSARSDDSSFQRSYSSRGRALGSSGREVLVLIDGKRINSDFTGGAGFHDGGISLDNVERVEFIRGPGSSLYGSNAVMGVINVITRSEREATAHIGSDAHRDGSLQWASGDQRQGLEVFAKQQQDPGEALDIFNASTQRFEATHDPLDERELHVRGFWQEVNASVRWAQHESREFYGAGYVNNDENKLQAETGYVNFGWTHALGDALTLEGAVFASDRQFQLHTQPAWPVQIDGFLNEREHGTEWHLKHADAKQQSLLGWEFRQPRLYNTVTEIYTDATTLSALPAAKESQRTISGIFGQYQWDINEAMQLIAGVRHDRYSDFGEHTSPRTGIIYQVDSQNTLKFLYAEAFRAPSRVETGSINSIFLVGNPDLKPEVARTTELVWLRAFKEGLLSVSLFDSQFKDAIIEVATDTTSRRTWINGNASEAGLELELQKELDAHWSSRLGLMHLFDRPADINSQATTLLSGSLVYQADRWMGSVRSYFQGARRDPIDIDQRADTEEYLPIGGRAIVGLFASYQWDPQIAVFAGIDNALDRKYLSPAQRYDNLRGVPERGRTGSLGVRWDY